MISKRDLYIKLGKLKSTEELLETVEEYIIKAAESGETHICYVFPEWYDKEAIDILYKVLADGNYIVGPGNIEPYKKIDIYW